MVLNNFLCEECGTKKEYSYRNDQIDSLRCKKCGSEKIRIQISAPAISSLNTKEKILELVSRFLN